MLRLPRKLPHYGSGYDASVREAVIMPLLLALVAGLDRTNDCPQFIIDGAAYHVSKVVNVLATPRRVPGTNSLYPDPNQLVTHLRSLLECVKELYDYTGQTTYQYLHNLSPKIDFAAIVLRNLSPRASSGRFDTAFSVN